MGIEPNVVTCVNCNTFIGTIVVIADGQERLLLGGALVNVARGVCATCGTEFHWSLSDRMLAELVQRVIKMRENIV